jgi:hypothetical protein
MTRVGMAKHLAACPRRQEVIAAADSAPGRSETLYHLQIQDAYGGQYWLQFEMSGSAPLEELDSYLRAIWLECCGHLSEFYLGRRYGEEVAMETRAGRIFQPGLQLTYIYDFGSSSETLVTVVAARQGKPTTHHPIALMARNDPPEATCMECDQPATWLCMECVYEHDERGTLCDEHAEEHPHTDYGEPMPLVNSPRVGICGYTGPADPPY